VSAPTPGGGAIVDQAVGTAIDFVKVQPNFPAIPYCIFQEYPYAHQSAMWQLKACLLLSTLIV
jgi:hypothetical protein